MGLHTLAKKKLKSRHLLVPATQKLQHKLVKVGYKAYFISYSLFHKLYKLVYAYNIPCFIYKFCWLWGMYCINGHLKI